MGMNETKEPNEVPDPEPVISKPSPCDGHEPEYELWKPDRLNPALAELNEDDRNKIFFCRSITSLLNKLTPENFPTISDKMKMLPIDSPTKMLQVVRIIHEKAILEWKYRALYAKICDHMQDITISDEFGIVKPFSLYLIAHCETFFHDSLSEDFRIHRKKFEIDLCFDEETKKSLMRDYEENEREFRKKSVGNCQFIGELFKVYLIHPKIIFLILDRLLKANGNMAVECICTLISTIGNFYEEKLKQLPAKYFNQLESLISSNELSSRIRFMIQDVLDLKKTSWRPRRLLELPKTLQQLEQEIIEEKKNRKLAESISLLNHITKKNRWTDISSHFFKDFNKTKNKNNTNQSKSTIKSSRDIEQTETIASPETTVSLESTDSKVLEEYTSEYLIPETTVVEEVTINNPKKLTSPFEKSDDGEKQSEVVLQADPCEKSFDNVKDISTLESKERLVVRYRKKYSVEFLKSLRHRPECKKLLSNVNVPDGVYSNYDYRKMQSNNFTMSVFKNTGRGPTLPTRKCQPDKSKRLIEEKNIYTPMTSILNKLAPERFNELFEEMKNLPINNVSELQGVVNLIYNRATDEPDNSHCYTELCRAMQDLNVPDEESGNKQTFKILLIKKCQQQFERDMDDELNVKKMQKRIELTHNIKMKKYLQSSFEKDEREFLRKSIGNFRFMGELFKLEMLTPNIMLRCIVKLVKSAGNVSLTCLCILLTTIGKDLEPKLSEVQKKEFESYFDEMQDLSENKDYQVSFRTRTMLQNVISLKQNHWISVSENECEADNSNDINKCDNQNNNVSEKVELPSKLKILSPDEKLEKSTCVVSEVINAEISKPAFESSNENLNAKVPVEVKPILKSKNLLTEEEKTQDLYKSLNSILNVLTPQDFDYLSERTKNLPIDNVSKLQGVVNLIYHKAINEPDSRQCCADVCLVMQNLNVIDEKTGRMHAFRVLLINKCQQEFEREMNKELDVVEKQKEIDVCTDPEMKKTLQSVLENNKREFVRKAVENCRLIGELFKRGIIIATTILRIIKKLLESADDVSLECLCELLKIIGNYLGSNLRVAERKEFAFCFKKMQDISKNKKHQVSTKIRSTLQVVITSKQYHWVRIPKGKSGYEKSKEISENNQKSNESEMGESTFLKILSRDEKLKKSINHSSDLIYDEAPRSAFEPTNGTLLDPKITAHPNPKSEKLLNDDEKTQELYKSVDNILNQLTTKHLYLLIQKIKKLPINNVSKLLGVINLIHEKAISDSNSGRLCAQMCGAMPNIAVVDVESCKMQTFNKLLINKCLQDFEHVMARKFDVVEKLKEIDRCTDKELKETLQSLLEKDVLEFHQKTIGNCRFMGELFKFNVITADILFRCIINLVNSLKIESADDLSLECLCTLLKFMGENLKSKSEYMKRGEFALCFKKMQDILKNETNDMSLRIRIMLVEVINVWKPVYESKSEANKSDEINNQKSKESEMVKLPSLKILSTDEKLEKSMGHSSDLIYDEVPKSVFEPTNGTLLDPKITAHPNPNSEKLLNDDKKTQDLYKSVDNILSQLTTTNVYWSIQKIKRLRINNVSKLQGVINLIHDKAISHSSSGRLCAEMCSAMPNIAVVDVESCKIQTFNKLLINKCLQQFEHKMVEEFDAVEKLKKIDLCTDKELKKELQILDPLEKNVDEFRQKAVGNCRFMSELFKFKMITAGTLFRCIINVVNSLEIESADDVSLECLCTLLKSMEEDLKLKSEYIKREEFLICFKKMRDILKNETNDISPRIRSMLLEVINDWKPVSENKSEADNSEGINEDDQERNGSKVVESSSELKILSTDEKLEKNICASNIISAEIPITENDKELELLLKAVFEQWTPNEELPNWFESAKYKSTSRLFPEAVSKLIELVMKFYLQNADKCGHFFAHLITHNYIQSEVIFRGLGCFLNTVENQQLPSEFELILNPLFERGILKLEDLNIIFQSNSDTKPIEFTQNEEKNTNDSQKKSSPEEPVKNPASSSQTKMPNIPAVQKTSKPLPSHFDPFSSVTSSMSDLSIRNIEDDNVKSKPIKQLINDLLITNPNNFQLKTFRRQLQDIPFEKVAELELAASCIIEMVEKNPDLYAFYFKLCCPMMMLTAEKMRFWIVLMKACHVYFHQKIFPQDTPKKKNKAELKKNKLKGFCRFFSLLVNKLNNQTANISVQRMMKKLLEIRKIEYFYEIYSHLEFNEARFQKSIFESYIPELLSSNELAMECQNMLKKVLEDYSMKDELRIKMLSTSKKNNQQQNQAATVTKQNINSKCSEQLNVTESSNMPNDLNNIFSRNETSTSVTSDDDTTSNAENFSENALTNPNSLPKKRKKKKKKKLKLEPSISREEISRIVDDILNQLHSHPNSLFELAKRIINMPIDTEKRFNDVARKIYNNALADDEFGKPYVLLCEHLQNWSIIDKNTGRKPSFKLIMISMIQSKLYTIKVKIETIKNNAETEKSVCYDPDLTRTITRHYRILCEFLKSPVFGCDLGILSAMKLLLLLDTIMDEDIMELLNEFSKILLDDLDLKFESLENRLLSSEAKNSLCQEFKKYNAMFEAIVLLQEIIHFQKYDFKSSSPESSIKGIGSNGGKAENKVESSQNLKRLPENRKIFRGKNVDSFLKEKPDFVEDIINRFEKERQNPEKLFGSIIRSLCSSFYHQSETEEPEDDISEEFSHALLLTIFGKKLPLFEFRCISGTVEFTKQLNFPSEILPKVFEFFFVYELIPYESFVQYKNFFVSKKVLQIIEILNSSPFKKYKLSKSPQD